MSNQYNLYRVEARDHALLVEHLQEAGFQPMPETQDVQGFQLTFFLGEDAPKEPVWVGLYRPFIPPDLSLTNQMQSGALVLHNSEHCFVVALGRAFHAIKKVCDKEFGLNLAERIVDEAEVKQKASSFFQSQKRKSIQSFVRNNPFAYDSGESVSYLKAKTRDPNTWGSQAEFGTSFRFSSKRDPGRLVDLIDVIIDLLDQEGQFSFPRTEKVRDESLIQRLDQILIDRIRADEEMGQQNAGMADFELQGCDFLFQSAGSFRFFLYGQKKATLVPVAPLSLESLRDFIRIQGIQGEDILRSVRVEVQRPEGPAETLKIKALLDIVIETNAKSYCLIGGDWYEFSLSYLDYLNEQIDLMEFQNVRGYDFARRPGGQYTRGQKGKKGRDEAWFLNEVLQKDSQFQRFHQESFSAQMEKLKFKHKVELMDLYKDQTLFIVKRGTPQKLGYAVDQGIASVNFLKEKHRTFRYGNKKYHPRAVCLWLVLRRNPIENLSEIKSTIFKMKLIEFNRVAQDAGLRPAIWVTYELSARADGAYSD